MASRSRWKLLAYTAILSGFVLGGILVYGRFEVQRPGGKQMNDSRIVVDHVRRMTGPSGFMLFGTQDHGALLRLAGQQRKAIQYVVGNPLFALQMTQYDIRASLYAWLSDLIYENDEGKTCVEYDKPSSLFGQFENAEIAAVAVMLDRTLAALVAASFE